MGIALEEVMARLPEERRRRVEARTAELVAEEMTLRDLRKAMGRTQVAMAEKLGLKQENVSRVEKRTDMLLSTLDGYLRAMGGRLRLTVEFEDRAPVRLSGLTHIDPVKTVRAKPAASKGKKTYAGRTQPKQPGARRRAASARASTPK
jgi:transcriptional regulator with XRE-family HTH domain